MTFPRNPDMVAHQLLKLRRKVRGLDTLYEEAAALLLAQARRIAELEANIPRGSADQVGEPLRFEGKP